MTLIQSTVKIALALILLQFYSSSVNCNFIDATEAGPEDEKIMALEKSLLDGISFFKLNLHKSLEQSRMSRKKRGNNLLYMSPKEGFEADHMKVGSTEMVSNSVTNSPDMEGITCWTSIESRDSYLLVWGLRSGALVFGQFTGPQAGLMIRSKFTDPKLPYGSKPYKLKHFVHKSYLWVVATFEYPRSDPNAPSAHTLVVYQLNGTEFHRKQHINFDDYIHVDIVNNKGRVYLGVATGPSPTGRNEDMSKPSTVKMYSWNDVQFDSVAVPLAELRGVRDMKLFKMSSVIYMATAQFNFPSAAVGSRLLLYQEKERDHHRLIQHEVIKTMSPHRVDHFRVEGNNYLMYSGPDDAVIFWWAGDQFLEYQTLTATSYAKDMATLKLVNGEVILALLFPNKVSFFTESITSQYEKTFEKVVEVDVNSGVLETINLLSFANKYFYSLFTFSPVSGGRRSRLSPIWKLKLVPHQSVNTETWDPLITCLLELEKDLGVREQELADLAAKADRVWVSNKPQNLTTPVIVEGKVVVDGTGTAEVQSMLITTNMTRVSQITNSQLSAHLNVVSNTVGHITHELHNFVYKSRSNQTIRGKLTFANEVTVRKGIIGNIVNPNVNINGITFHDLLHNTLKVNGDQVISGRWTFADNLWADNIQVRGHVNGLSMGDLLLTNTNATQLITGNLRFRNVSIGSDIKMTTDEGLINGIRLKDFVTTKPGPLQVITGKKMFRDIEVKQDLEVEGLTNGWDLSLLAKKVVKLINRDPQVITGDITFEGKIEIDNLEVKGLINGRVNVTQMRMFGVTKDGDQVIGGHKTWYAPVTVSGDVHVSGLVNGLNFYRDVVTINSPQSILAPMIFRAPVTFTRDLTTDTVNGLNLRHEAVLKASQTPQVITSRKVFKETIRVTGEITMDVGSTIDTVDPSELAKVITDRNNITLDGPLFFDQVKVNGSITATKGINGYAISDLPNKLWLKSKDQVIPGPVTFLGPIHVKSMSSGLVNGMNFPEDFVLKSSSKDQLITGEKIFLDEVRLLNGGFSTSPGVKMNGVDLVALNRDIVRNLPLSGNATDPISGSKTFKNLRVKGNIVAKRVNGLDLGKDVMVRNKNQVIYGKIVFAAPETEVKQKVEVRGNVGVDETVNNVRLNQWMKDVVLVGSYESRVRPIRNKHFTGHLRAERLTAHGTVDGVNLDEMKARVVTLNTPQIISAPKNFSSDVRFDGDLEVRSLNGLNISEFSKRVVLKNKPTTVTGRKTVRGKVSVGKELTVTGLVNGVNLTELATNAMSRSRDNVIPAHMTFGGNVFIKELVVDVNQRLDGLLLKDLVFLHENNTLHGSITLEGDVSLEGDLIVKSDTINGCNLRSLSQDSIPLNPRGTNVVHVIRGRKNFGVLDVDGNLNVQRTINSLNISQLASRVVTVDGKDQYIEAHLTFEDKVIVDNLILLSPINGVDLTGVFRDAVLKSKPQSIRGKKLFTQDLIVSKGALSVTGNLSVGGVVNGVDINQLNGSLVTKHGHQVIAGVKTFISPGETIFRKNVTVSGTINGLRFPRDLVLLNTDNDTIPGNSVFKHPTVMKRDLMVKGRVDGVDLSKLVNSRLSLSGDQIITSSLVFRDNIKIDNLIVRKTINGIPVKEFVTKDGNHVLRGKYEFARDVVVKGDIIMGPQSKLNGIDIQDLSSRAISLNKEEFVSGYTRFQGPMNIGSKGIHIKDGLLNGVDVRRMAEVHKNSSVKTNAAMTNFIHRINQNEQQLRQQMMQAEVQPTSLSYFDLWYEFSNDNKGRDVTIERFMTLPVHLFNASVYNRRLFDPIAQDLLYWRIKNTVLSNPPCREYSTISLRVHEEGQLEARGSVAPKSRAFPIYANPIETGLLSAFYLWTNTTHCRRPGAVPDSFENSKIVTMFVGDKDKVPSMPGPQFASYGPEKMSPYLKDAKFFADSQELYVVLAYSYEKPSETSNTKSLVYRFNKTSKVWSIQQRIQTFGAISLDIVTYEPYGHKQSLRIILLAIANRLTVRGSPASSIIMKWNGTQRKFEHISATHTWSPSSVLFVPTIVKTLTPGLLLVFANEKAKLFGGECDSDEDSIFNNFGDSYSSFFTQPINVYSYNGRGFDHIQSIDIPGVNTMDRFSLPPAETFLVVGSKLLGRSYVLKFKGYNNFQVIMSFSTPGVEHLKIYWSPSGDLFLAIASSKPGHSKILKAVMSGPSPKLWRINFGGFLNDDASS